MDADSQSFFSPIAGRAAHFLTGCAAALLTVQLFGVWATICGWSPESSTALWSAVAVACVCELRISSVSSRLVATLVVLTLAICGYSWLLPSVLNQLLTFSAGFFDAVPLVCFFAPAVFAGLTAFVAIHWSSTIINLRQDSTISRWLLALGLATGFSVSHLHGLTVLPAFLPVVVATLAAAILAFVAYEWGPHERELPEASPTHVWLLPWPQVVSGIGFGAFAFGCCRFITTLMPLTLPVVFTSAAMVVVLLTFVDQLTARGWVSGSRRMPGLLLVPGLVPLFFDQLTEFNLFINATFDSVTQLILLRSLQLAVLCMTGAIPWLAVNSLTASRGLTKTSAGFIAVGVTLASCFAAVGCSFGVLLALGIVLMSVSLMLKPADEATGDADNVTTRFADQRFVFAATSFVALAVTLVPIDTTRATQLLFSSRAAQGFRAGLDSDVIAQSTGFRLLEETISPNGRLTSWHTSGDQVLLRRDGVALGQVSTNTHTTPQPVADTLPVLLPLVMHKNASSVLVLGDETGEGLRVCSDFPVHTVVAVRPDRATTEFAVDHVWSNMETPPQQDERFHIVEDPVSVGVRRFRRDGEHFDAVVAVSPNPTTISSLEQLTPEFYAAVRNQLTDQGVFCQRITRHDVGAVPLVRIISAISRCFGRVTMIHMAAGELAVVASVQPDSLLDSGLLKRLQREHVGRVLSRSGWDWSQVAALPVVDTNDPVGVFEHQDRLSPSSADNLHFAFALPLEASAWTDKAAELRQTFAPHQQRLADAAQRNPLDYQEFARRFSAVVQQAEILSTFPDQPWPYRRSLRTEMQRNARPPVERVHNGSVMKAEDPRDEYRKDYFINLGDVLQQAKNGPVDPLSLRKLSSFTNRYEPLLSLFAHHELIRIHEATGHPSPALEFRHRLHTVYFTEGGDFSIRQLVTALEQILDDPELISDVSDRFDHVNSMLQELVRRWELRRNYDPPSARQTQADIDNCIAVAKRGLDALYQWAPEIDVDPEEITARRRYVNQALVSPLRSYHDTVLAHRIKNESPASESEGDLPLLIDPTNVLTD